MKPGKLIRRFVLYPLLGIWAAVTLFTGSPFPTWDLESLNSPVIVKSVKADGLLLEDGRTIKLPFVKRIPAEDPLMLAAVEHGVEIADDGKVFGLLRVDRACGVDTCVWYRRRVNLASLAAILLPDNLDESQVSPEVVEYILEMDSDLAPAYRPRRYDERRIDMFGLMRMHRIQENLDYALNRQKSGDTGSYNAVRAPQKLAGIWLRRENQVVGPPFSEPPDHFARSRPRNGEESCRSS